MAAHCNLSLGHGADRVDVVVDPFDSLARFWSHEKTPNGRSHHQSDVCVRSSSSPPEVVLSTTASTITSF